MHASRIHLLLLSLCARPTRADFDVTLLVTREIRGAQYPVLAHTTEQCPKPAPVGVCPCIGGAARRKTILDQTSGSGDLVKIDTPGPTFLAAEHSSRHLEVQIQQSSLPTQATMHMASPTETSP